MTKRQELAQALLESEAMLFISKATGSFMLDEPVFREIRTTCAGRAQTAVVRVANVDRNELVQTIDAYSHSTFLRLLARNGALRRQSDLLVVFRASTTTGAQWTEFEVNLDRMSCRVTRYPNARLVRILRGILVGIVRTIQPLVSTRGAMLVGRPLVWINRCAAKQHQRRWRAAGWVPSGHQQQSQPTSWP